MRWALLIPLSAVLGFLIDCVIGDPEWLPHPVRLIGRLISALEKALLKESDMPKQQTGKGLLFAVLVTAITAAATGLITTLVTVLGYRLYMTAGNGIKAAAGYLIPLIVYSVLSAYCLAAKNLKDASMKVCRALEKERVGKARRAVSMIVGRDTSVLDEKGIARAAVESVAESTSDGVIAPLFYLMIGGPVLGMAYKAINTMDSMVGYKNDKYRHFGTAAAELDDIVNYIPSRLSALAMIAAAYILRYDGKNARKIFKRDRNNHASPNSAQTESVCAGALGLKLAGPAVYFGEVHDKPYIGDALKEIEPNDIRRANKLMYAAAALSVIVYAAVRILIIYVRA